MQNKHQEHFEDLLLTGDFRALNAILGNYHLSTKIDGSVSIIFGTDPSNGKFFCGTKSALNKIKKKICYTVEDIHSYYDGNLREVLIACLKYLPHVNGIYQGDFIGFGGSDEYKPNTLTYKFPEVVSEKIILAVHTQWHTESDLSHAYVVGPAPIFDTDEFVKFIDTSAYQIAEKDDFTDVIGFIRQMATTVTFATDKEAQKIKKQINTCIRENREVNSEDFENSNLISLWKVAESVKLDFLHFCRSYHAPDSYLGYDQVNQEGFVLQTDDLIVKFVNRYSFSRSNFIRY